VITAVLAGKRIAPSILKPLAIFKLETIHITKMRGWVKVIGILAAAGLRK
jgi:hypothetical protein